MDKAVMLDKTHLDQSFTFNGEFKEKFYKISEYCKTYRKDCYLIYNDLLEKS